MKMADGSLQKSQGAVTFNLQLNGKDSLGGFANLRCIYYILDTDLPEIIFGRRVGLFFGIQPTEMLRRRAIAYQTKYGDLEQRVDGWVSRRTAEGEERAAGPALLRRVSPEANVASERQRFHQLLRDGSGEAERRGLATADSRRSDHNIRPVRRVEVCSQQRRRALASSTGGVRHPTSAAALSDAQVGPSGGTSARTATGDNSSSGSGGGCSKCHLGTCGHP